MSGNVCRLQIAEGGILENSAVYKEQTLFIAKFNSFLRQKRLGVGRGKLSAAKKLGTAPLFAMCCYLPFFSCLHRCINSSTDLSSGNKSLYASKFLMASS